MSIQKLVDRFNPSEVVCFRLVNGDEILGRYNSDAGHPKYTQNTTLLERVRHIMVSQTRDGIGISLMPWSFCNVDGVVAINNESIMAVMEPSADMISSYLQQTTNIQLVS